MKPEQQRKIVEAAAKACGITLDFSIRGDFPPYYVNSRGGHSSWNPVDSSTDCAAMCAKLKISTFFYESLPRVECSCEDAGNEQPIRYAQSYATEADREAAWRLAATMVAAKTQGWKE